MNKLKIEQILKQGEEYFNRGDFTQAKSCFVKILQIEQHHLEALNNLGVIAFSQEFLEDAISYFRKALEISPNYVEAIENLAKCLEAKGDISEALKLFQKRIKIGNVNTDILNAMGNCFLQINDLNSAFLIYKESIQIDGDQDLIQQILDELESLLISHEGKEADDEAFLTSTNRKLKHLSAKENFRIQIVSFSDFETDDERRLRWGDHWVKKEIEKELQALGHTITDNSPDILLHFFGTPLKYLPENTYNIIWIHSHPDWITSDLLDKYDKIYCLSPQFIKRINSWGFDAELLIGGSSKKPLKSNPKYDIVFVANGKGNNGRKIIKDLGNLNSLPYNLKIWGEGWEGILPEKFYGGMYYNNEDLGELYASSLICLNDHHNDMRKNGFINPRIFDVLSSGGFCISDNLVGLEKILEDSVPSYKTPEELRSLIDYYICNFQVREKLIQRGCKIALSYSYQKMARQLMESIKSEIRSRSKIKILKDGKSQNENIKLDLGCGKKKKEDFIGLDIKAMPGVDIVCDITKGISLRNNSVKFVIADNLMEHIGDEFIDVMNDIWRICKPESIVKLIVPGIHTSAAFQDPTHKRFFVQETFDYFNAEHDRWKLYGSTYGIKPFKILSAGLRKTDQRFIEVEMTPVKDTVGKCEIIERQEVGTNLKRTGATEVFAKNVLVSFGFVPHSTAGYLIRALKKKGGTIRSCGPLDKTTLLKTWSEEQLTRLVPLHDVATDHDTSIIKVINSFKDGWYPDLFLWVESSMNFPNFPSELSKLRCPSVGYFIDSHTKLDWHLKFAPRFDYVFVAQKAYIPAFKNVGCQRVSWLPLACDPEIHGKHDVQKEHDIAFVGNLYSGTPLYERRERLLDLLKKKYDVKIEQRFFEEMALSFSKAHLVFNISAKDDLNMRVFEGLASGSLLLTDRAPGSGLTDLFQDRKDLVIYNDSNNLFELVDYYLKHSKERRDISSYGMRDVLDHHTYENRIDKIYEVIENTWPLDQQNEAQPVCTVKGDNSSKLRESTEISDVGLTVTGSRRVKNGNSDLRILAAFAHFNWEDYNLQPALEDFGEVIRLSWPPYNQYEKDWHFSKKQWFNIRLLQAVKKAHETNPIDVFFGYVSGRLVFPSTVRAIGRMGIRTLSMCLDDRSKFNSRLEPSGYAGMVDIASAFSLCWTSTEDAVELYESVGARAIYLPEGANPCVYKPLNTPFDIDVSFVGQCYGQRPKIVEYLQTKGVNVQTFGRGWSSGELPVEEMVKIYSRSRINLGFSAVGDSKDIYCLKGRDFEVPMSGGLYFTQYHPEIENVYQIGKEIVCYHDMDDLAEKIKYYLEHQDEADKIRKAGYDRAIKEHTWIQRFRVAFKEMGLFKKELISQNKRFQDITTQKKQRSEKRILLGKCEDDITIIKKSSKEKKKNIFKDRNFLFSEYFLYLYEKYASELKELREIEKNRYNQKIFPTTGQYDLFESQILYMLIRDAQPENVVEFSSNCGYSTLFTASALKRNGKGYLHSFEFVPDFLNTAKKNIFNYGLSNWVNFILGDVKKTLIPYIEGELKESPDIVFIDSDHSYPFARWYIQNIFPLLKKETLVHVHDVLPPSADVLIDNGSRKDVVTQTGENKAINEFLQRNGYLNDKGFCYLHEMTFCNFEWMDAVKEIYSHFIPYRQGKDYVSRRMNLESILTEWNATLWFKYVKNDIPHFERIT